MNHFFKKVHIRNIRCKGFVLPFTMLIATLVLFITTGALAILSKQQYFSRIYKQTQAAYYAADDAVACATSLDDTYVGQDGIGIFPVASTTDKDEYINGVLQYVSTKRDLAVTLTQADVKCGQSPIFVPGGTPSFNPGFSIVDDSFVYHFTNPVTGLPDREYGVTSSYNMKMDLGVDPSDITGVTHLYRCAKITVKKTPSFRQIIAQGYSSCNISNAIERAVVNTTIIE